MHPLVSRLGQTVLVFFGTSLLVFLAVFALPGDPIQALAGDAELSETVVRNLEEKYHLNEPLLAQYGHYLFGLMQGDFGTTVTGRSVSDILAHAWPVTIQLGLTAWALELVLGIGLGLAAALRAGGLIDRLVTSATILSLAVPTFVIAFFAQQVLALQFGWFPVAGGSDGWPVSYLLPALCLATLGFGPIARLTRTSVVQTLGVDFVRTARAKGISPARVAFRHVLRNALVPVVTYLGLDLGAMLGGTIVVEGVFNLPGVGRALYTAVSTQQGSVVVGIVSATVLIALVANITVDLLHRVLDPRITHD